MDADAFRLIGEASAVQRGKKPLTTLVAGENSAGAVAAMGSGRQSDNADTGISRAEARQRAAPILFIFERGPFFSSHLFSPLH